jgi:hypothetical protein
MAETEFQKYAKQAQETWSQKKNAVPGVPDGTYQLQLQSMELKKSSTDKWMVHREHVVTEGQHTGEVIHDYVGLEGEYGPRQINEFIQKMGHESPEDFADLEGILNTIAGDAPSYQGKVKKAKDGDLRNVTILQVYAPGEAPSVASPTPAATKKPVSVKAPAKTEVAHGRAVGEEVKFAEGETVLKGKIVELKPDGAVMETADGSLYEQTFEFIYDKDGEAEGEPAAEEPPAEEAEDTSNLIAFCQAHGIEVAEDESGDSIREKLRSFEFTRDELTKEEQEILDGIEGISWKEKPKPPVKKTPPPPAKKAPTPPPAAAKKSPPPASKKPAPAPAKKSPPPKKK